MEKLNNFAEMSVDELKKLFHKKMEQSFDYQDEIDEAQALLTEVEAELAEIEEILQEKGVKSEEYF